MLNANQLKVLIIKPALLDLILYSESAVQLLLFTCAVESDGGTYIHQINGPALGIYQMEPSTYNDLWINCISERNDLKLQLLHQFDVGRMPVEDRMVYDIRYATAMARIFYARFKEALPSASDTTGLWNYYKKYYNTSAGKSNYSESIDKYNLFIKS